MGGCQVGIGKTNVSEPLLNHRNAWMTSETGFEGVPGMSLAVCPQCWPGGVRLCWRRDPGLLGLYETGEGAPRLWGAGGPARSSVETPVMGVEPRGWVVRDVFVSVNQVSARSWI